MVAAESSTDCSRTRKASRAPETWLSAARGLLAACLPLYRGCLAFEKVFGDGRTDRPWRIRAVIWGFDEVVGIAARGEEGVGVLIAGAGGDGDPWTIARQRLRHVLVGGAHRGALRIELRIDLIGAHQRGLDRVGQCRRRTETGHQED